MMREVRKMHVFPNISNSLTRSLLSIKSKMLRMSAAKAIMAARQPAAERLPDVSVNITPFKAILWLPPLVRDVVPVPSSEMRYTEQADRAAKDTDKQAPHALAANPSKDANIGSFPGAA
jgi:hypothetical protein